MVLALHESSCIQLRASVAMAGGKKSGKSGKSGWTRWKDKKKAIKGQKVRNEEIQKLIQERERHIAGGESETEAIL